MHLLCSHPSQNRQNLIKKFELFIFTCYSLQSKGYRIYNLETGKLMISRDVLFVEDEACDWNNKKV